MARSIVDPRQFQDMGNRGYQQRLAELSMSHLKDPYV